MTVMSPKQIQNLMFLTPTFTAEVTTTQDTLKFRKHHPAPHTAELEMIFEGGGEMKSY